MSNPLDMITDSELGFQKKGPSKLWIVALLLLVGGALALALWPTTIIVEDCGDLAGPKADQVKLKHGMYCNLVGHVETDQVVAIGQEDPRQTDPTKRFAGVRYFVKLDSKYDVLAALSAADPAIRKYQARRGSLLGMEVNGVGRVFDPRKEKGYDVMNKALRHKFGFGDRKVMVFDTAAKPPK